jgi:hypothetical protein
MNYYLDTEFIEGQQSLRLFEYLQSLPTIDLISIGIVSQDGENTQFPKTFNLKEAWNRNQKEITNCV